MDEQEFVNLLQALLQPDTQKVKEATSKLNQSYYKSPASVQALIHIITSHSSPELRQLASVEARKLVGKHWSALPEQSKPQLRDTLLKSTIDEEKPLPRHSKARVIAAIAKIDLAEEKWTELPGLLQQASTSQNVRHREVGVYIIFTLLEAMPDLFQENMAQTLQLFNQTIQDPESQEVRINTMLALSELAMVLDTEEDVKGLRSFQSTIPHMVQVLQSAISSGDDDRAMQAFDVFNKLLSYESAFLNAHFGDLMQLFTQIASNTEVDDDIRSQAFSFLMQAVRFRKMKVQSLKIGEQLTKVCVQVATELDEVPETEDDTSPARSALGMLDIMSETLPPSQVAVPLLKIIGPYVQNENPAYRRAGILALGMCVEGSPDFIATQLNEILPLVLHLLEDQDTSVRSAALNGVARLADDLAEDMGREHARLMPALVRNFDLAVQGLSGSSPDSTERLMNSHILKSSCIAVDSLIEGLEPKDAALYVSELVPRFAQLVDNDDYRVQQAAVGAIGSIGSAAEGAFAPYFDQCMQGFGKYIDAKDNDEQLELRSVVIDSIGKIAPSVGPERFQPFVQPLMRASEEGLHLNNQRLKETSFILWSSLARVYGEHFEPFLPGVVQSVLKCLEQDEVDSELQLGEEASELAGQEITIAGKRIKVGGGNGVSDSNTEQELAQALMDAEDASDDEGDWDDLGAVTAIAMEKEVAIEVIGDVLTHAKGKFLPYMEKVIETVLPMLDHSFEGIRKSAVSTLWRSYACMWELSEKNGMAKWQPGLPAKVPITEDLKKLGHLVMLGTLALCEEEIDRMTITEVNRNIAATLKLCGPAILTPAEGQSSPIEQITKLLMLVLQKQHSCQKEEDEDEEFIEEESSEYDWLVIETALEVVASLSAALGEQFGELWKIFETPIMKYASSQERLERSSALGTIADCVQHMQSACTPFAPRMMRVLLKRLGDEDPEVKSNAAFAVGLVCQYSGDSKDILSNYGPILTKLEPLFGTSAARQGASGQARLVDNAAGCVARMIKRSPQHVPLGDVLPRLVDTLPLKEDYDENEPVYDTIISLYQQQNSDVQQLSGRLLPIFQTVLGPPEEQLQQETRTKLQELVQYLQNQQ